MKKILVEVSADREFGQLISSSQTTDARLVLAGIASDTIYVRVKAINDDGNESAFSDVASFTPADHRPLYVWILTSLLLLLAGA